ncbi:hypothetical protein EST38_g8158 [Candolleomyces aberdarensis]|uniref:Uncharacterized protein n=1 Tax=Candolleomyces aberdarensis TaxID=2316362 RepID=A0A4Q2DG47_9AGAR|nr:hypothetical protein EST38_g8158 [Candolleomyces aberdarensis]
MSGVKKAEAEAATAITSHDQEGQAPSEASPPQEPATDVAQSKPRKVASPQGGRISFSRRQTSQRTLTFDPYAEEEARQLELEAQKQQSALQPNRRKAISIGMGTTLHAREMKYPGPGNLTLFDGRTLEFEAVLISADPKAGMMRLDWRILKETNSACRSDNLPACTEVDIFFDTNLLKAEGTFSTQEETLSSNPPDRPIFKFNATALVLEDRFSRTPTFRTQLALFSPDRSDSSLIFYPFDAYTAEIIFFARENRTGNTVGVSIKQTRGIAVYGIIVLLSKTPCLSVVTYICRGLETEFGHTFNSDVPPGLVEATITLTRSTLVKSYSIVSTIAIWLITIILALVMITTVFFGFKQRGEVLLIPVATLFAFTQLRQSMPGAPDGFGDIVDLVGIVPCLALLALTAAFSLGAFILTDPTNMPRQVSWKLMHDAFPSLNTSPKEEKEQELAAKNP